MQLSAEPVQSNRPNPPTTTIETPALELTNVCRRFHDVIAVDQINLSIRRGEFFSLLGPSGCGKTTLLRIIAGLDQPDAGAVSIDGKDATRIPAHRRPVNTVFQSYALFPHLNVRANVGFALQIRKTPRTETERRVNRVMELVRISELGQRRPAQLSGGQKQRVALARAIVNEPQVLLLDEPLGALDLKLRKELQVELHALQRRLGITFIYVTHDQEEALAMSDRIGVMNAGRLEQCGPVADVYERPRTRFVAQFLGACNLIAGVVRRCAEGTVWTDTPLGEVRAEIPASARPRKPGEPCTFALRPERVRLLKGSDHMSGPNTIAARIADLIYFGAETEYRLEMPGGTRLSARAMNANAGSLAYRVGEEIHIQWPPSSLVLLDP
ncbi:MAG: ABC transporter ATP-binding protein [Verrucomicrobia bacterium]|nr:ABC transporter ATP-binding protein [Verrucomicrobiota bacterium]